MGDKILRMFQEWVEDGTTTIFNILSEFIFGYEGLNGFATNLYGVFVFFGGILLVVMVLCFARPFYTILQRKSTHLCA